MKADKKKIRLEVKNGAIEPDYVKHNILDITLEVYGRPFYLFLKKQSEDFRALDCGIFYVNERSKITIVLKKILCKCLEPFQEYTREYIEKLFSIFANKITALYYPKYEIDVFFGNKAELGNGIYESGSTCFSDDGCNSICKDFLMDFHRARVLVIQRQEQPEQNIQFGTARAIVFFAGNRNIEITNFYGNGLYVPKAVWIESLRRLLNISKVTWKEAPCHLPIYRNGDSILITTEKTQPMDLTTQKWNCPHCGRMVKQPNFYCESDGSSMQIGCEDCYDIDVKKCQRCGEHCHDLSYIESLEMEICDGCSDDLYYCEHCNTASFNEMERISGSYYCQDCYSVCEVCNASIAPDREHHVMSGELVCSDCCFTCSLCGNDVLESNLTSTDKGDICEDCHDELLENQESEKELINNEPK
jgi:hypothetical protein